MESRMTTAMPGGPNFLARVIERAQGVANPVLPRVPGLFEPVAEKATAIAADAGERQGEFDRGPRQQFDAEIAPHEFRSREPPRGRSQDGEIARRGSSWTQQQAGRVGEFAFARTHDQIMPVAHSVAPEASARHAPRGFPTDRDATPHRLLADSSVLAHDAGLAGRPDQKSSHRDERPESAASAVPAASVTRMDDQARSGILVPQHLAPDLSTRQSPTHQSAREIPAQATAPDIHISIGRVEVRALTTAAKSAAATRDGNARRSTRLDDYLSRRGRAR
jgi:hypothetical protein